MLTDKELQKVEAIVVWLREDVIDIEQIDISTLTASIHDLTSDEISLADDNDNQVVNLTSKVTSDKDEKKRESYKDNLKALVRKLEVMYNKLNILCLLEGFNDVVREWEEMIVTYPELSAKEIKTIKNILENFDPTTDAEHEKLNDIVPHVKNFMEYLRDIVEHKVQDK